MPATMPAIRNIWHEKMWLYSLKTAFFALHATHATHAGYFLKKVGYQSTFSQFWGGYSAHVAWLNIPPTKPGENKQ